MLIIEIENMIQATLAEPDSEDELRLVLEAVAAVNDENPSEAELAAAVEFVTEYIEQVPYCMTVARAAAKEVGLEDGMETVFEQVHDYWVDPQDLIPDRMGLLGLLDDAYGSMSFLQHVSDYYRMHTGKFLFPADMTPANQAIRRVLGEPYISKLEAMVDRQMKQTGLIEAMQALAHHSKKLFFEGRSSIWGHDPIETVVAKRLKPLGIGRDGIGRQGTGRGPVGQTGQGQ